MSRPPLPARERRSIPVRELSDARPTRSLPFPKGWPCDEHRWITVGISYAGRDQQCRVCRKHRFVPTNLRSRSYGGAR